MSNFFYENSNLLPVEHYTTNSTFAQDCKYGQGPMQKGEICRVSMDSFGECGPDYSYGFAVSTPCIFLKLNRVRNQGSIYELSRVIKAIHPYSLILKLHVKATACHPKCL